MATQRQRKVVDKLSENIRSDQPKPLGTILVESGYSESIALTPAVVVESKGVRELMDEMGLGDKDLAEKHKGLLNAHRLDHMVFPLGPDKDLEGDLADEEDSDMGEDALGDTEEAHARNNVDRTELTDDDIKQLLTDVGCVVRRVVHGQTARHVYFWSPDNKARKDALDMGYKLRGSYAPDKGLTLHAHVTVPEGKAKEIANKYTKELKAALLDNTKTK